MQQQTIEGKLFVFDNGDHLLFDSSLGKTIEVIVIKPIYSYSYPAYLVRRAHDPIGKGYDVPQNCLRRDVWSYAKQHSPAYVHR